MIASLFSLHILIMTLVSSFARRQSCQCLVGSDSKWRHEISSELAKMMLKGTDTAVKVSNGKNAVGDMVNKRTRSCHRVYTAVASMRVQHQRQHCYCICEATPATCEKIVDSKLDAW